jgi:thiol-disulfide isomerase/thioredoxin
MNRTSFSYFSIALAILLLFGLSLASCSNENAGKAVKLTPIKLSQWQQTLSSYRPDIVVVDVWATWCETCLAKFPRMVELARQYRGQGVQFLSLNMDDRNSPEEVAMAEQFLEKMQADFPHYFMDENMMDAFDALQFMSLPVVLIYDGEGNERFRLSGDNPNQQFTDADVEKSIEALL